MTASIGHAATLAGLLCAVFGVTAGSLGSWLRAPALIRASRWAAFALLPIASAAAAALMAALLRHDFSLAYVAQNGSRETPAFYTAISLWGRLEGSILLWVLVLTGFIAAAAWTGPRRAPALYPVAQTVLLAIAGFFFWLVSAPADPFVTISPVPADGPGPNPLLQNHALMAIHPPLLYVGLVGFSVPFAYAIAALVTGRLDETWIRVTRGSTLFAWAFLALGIVLGGAWSYAVLGWGGYFAWDPVENVSLLPWFTATAFVHSVMMQERRDMLKLWNLTLIVATFVLTILTTFLTRSGVLSSVHAFSEGVVGPALLAFIGVTLAVSIGLLVWRGERLRSEGVLESALSRETVFLLNNLLLVGLTLTVLLGTLFPLIAEAVNGSRLSVGEPYFNVTAIPIVLTLLFLMGVGPALPWHVGSRAALRERLLIPAAAGSSIAVAGAVAGVGKLSVLAALGLGAFVGAHVVVDLVRLGRRGALRVRHRRVGGQIVHLGVAVMAVGIAVSSGYKRETQATLRPGQSVQVASQSVRLDGLQTINERRRRVLRANLTLNGQRPLSPTLNLYNNQREATASPSILPGALRDVYVLLVESKGNVATIRVLLNPLVTWIWFGGALLLIGAAIAGLPLRRRRSVPA